MTLSSVVLLLLRRWYLALLGLLLTVALGVGAASVVKPEYDAAASILLLPSTKIGGNPYTNLAGVPGVPAVLSRVLHDSAYVDKYKKAGIRNYEVTPDDSAGGPAVLVIGKGSTEEKAIFAMKTVMADVAPALRELQVDAGVSRPNLITSRLIYVETEATKVGKKQTRAVIAAVGAGLVLTLFIVGAVDALIRRRAARRDTAQRAADASQDAAPPPQDAGPPPEDAGPPGKAPTPHEQPTAADPRSIGRVKGETRRPAASRAPRRAVSERSSGRRTPGSDAG